MASPRPGLITLVYLLSEDGRRSALLSGRNAGEKQTLLVYAPGSDPTQLAELAGAVKSVADATKVVAESEEATPDAKAKLAEMVQALVKAAFSLGIVLNPQVALNLSIETADQATWEGLCKLARVNPETGEASLAIRFGDLRSYSTRTWRDYTCVPKNENQRRGPKFDLSNVFEFGYLPVDEDGEFDSIQTAAQLLYAQIDLLADRERNLARVSAEVIAANEDGSRRAFIARRGENLTKLRYALGLEEDGSFSPPNPNGFDDKVDFVALRQSPEYLAVRAFYDAVLADPTSLGEHKYEFTEAIRKVREEMKRMEGQREMEAWITANGSPNLKRLLAAGLVTWGGYLTAGGSNQNLYVEELLAFEMPGWRRSSESFSGGDHQVGTPTLADLDLLAVARKQAPTAELRNIGNWKDRRIAAISKWRDQTIYFVLPDPLGRLLQKLTAEIADLEAEEKGLASIAEPPAIVRMRLETLRTTLAYDRELLRTLRIELKLEQAA